MQSPYYQSTSKGYVLTHREPPSNVDHSKQLPVYRVVNEFMNLEQHQQQTQQEKEQIYVDIVLPTSKESSRANSEVKFLSRNPSIIMEKDEIQSIYTLEEMPLPQKDNRRSMRELKFNATETTYRSNTLANESETKTEAITSVQKHSQRKSLEFELEKERILRRNLEKSYQNLLTNMRERETVFAFDDQELHFNPEKYTDQYPSTERVNKGAGQGGKQVSSTFLNEESQKRRKSCFNFNGKKGNESEQESKSEKSSNMSYHSLIPSYYEKERLNNIKFQEQMLTLQMRIQEIDHHIYREELSAKMHEQERIALSLENDYLRQNLENQKLKASEKSLSNQSNSGLTKKEHMNYIFTIFMVFLCLAMTVKSRN